MRPAGARQQGRAQRESLRSILGRVGAVLLGALLLAWPAFFNGFPLLYPDSMTYLGDGPMLARALFLRRFSDYYGMRSPFYSLGIYALHWSLTPWPIVALQCLLVAWVLWLVTRSIAPRRAVTRSLLLILFLSLLTSASWYADFVMPDVLGPVLCLSIYLLVFAPDTLGRAERLALYPLAWWCVTSHATHLLLGGGLCALLLPWSIFERRRFPMRLRGLGQVAAILLVAAASQLALNAYLDGKPTLNSQRPPFLMARILADGPGRWYLEKNCGREQWAVCGHAATPSADPDSFLWGPAAPYEISSEDEKRRMEAEEMPFVLATLRAYPGQQLSRSAANFKDQLLAFGLYGFDANPWMLEQMDDVLPTARAGYLMSRQARNALPLDLLTAIQWWTVLASLVAIALLAPLLWRRHSHRLAGLSLVVVGMVAGNALVTGVLSMVDDRYGCRVIWLLPLLAFVLLLDWLEQRRAALPA